MAPPKSPSADQQQDEKLLGTPDVGTELESQEPASDDHKSPTKIEGALSDLLYCALLPCVLVVLVSTTLLAIIFTHRVDLDPGWQLLEAPSAENVSHSSLMNRTLKLMATGGNAAYYVRYNPAILAAIASWTSKIIPFFTSSSMAVIAFFAGRRILHATRDNETSQLPTPHQLSILIKMLSCTGASPLWDTILYKWQNHAQLVQPIPLTFGALSFVLIVP